MSPYLPKSTYRIQFHPGFTFYDAVQVLDYIRELGISHVYASPYLQAVKGSTHGYDAVDPSRVNVELGGEAAHRQFCAALEENGLGQVMDIVPNHMAISLPGNVWWKDVLENGPSSRYAGYFDVDWETDASSLENRILLPVLEDHYGTVLDSELIKLELREGYFIFTYRDHLFPAAPRSLSGIVRKAGGETGSGELLFLADSLDALPLPSTTDRKLCLTRQRNRDVIFNRLNEIYEENPEILEKICHIIEDINSDPESLDALLQRQNYRLAFWRKSREDVDYRRFFDINSLVGLHMEEKHVFKDTHSRIFEWATGGLLSGLRVDHPDGLEDPKEYFSRLREQCPDMWIIAEKILHPGEELRKNWPVDGTTGYDFMYYINQAYIDRESRESLSRLYREFSGENESYDEILIEKKRLVLNQLFGSDLNRLSSLLAMTCEKDRHFRDYTRRDLRKSLEALIASLDVYRTYISSNQERIDCEDIKVLENAMRKAKEFNPQLDEKLLKFIVDIFSKERKDNFEDSFISRFQQLSSPVMAKGAEDTAFYCYNRLICLNEVGGDPGTFGIDLKEFHSYMSRISRDLPHTMVSLNTHDTKRNSDVRSRLAVISEIPAEWAETVNRWSRKADKYRTNDLPDRNAEYFIFQTLAGAWPIGPERLLPYLEKAARESKEHTSWFEPDPQYEEALFSFADNILSDEALCADIESFVDSITHEGHINSLSQTLLMLTAPGVPDIYQGTELWNLSLVDPDNRRPVDYEIRRAMLERARIASHEKALMEIDAGLTKIWLIERCLKLREKNRLIFDTPGNYSRVRSRGASTDHLIAFSRGSEMVVLTPRLVKKLNGNWMDTEVLLPEGEWENLFTGDTIECGWQRVENIFEKFPLTVLVEKNSVSMDWR